MIKYLYFKQKLGTGQAGLSSTRAIAVYLDSLGLPVPGQRANLFQPKPIQWKNYNSNLIAQSVLLYFIFLQKISNKCTSSGN